MQTEYHFFWKGVLSQWHSTTFTSGGFTFNCCEQYMMARKAWLFGDMSTLARIMSATSPAVHKMFGRQVEGFNQFVWDREKFAIVVKGNRLRAEQDEKFRNALLATGDKVIVEASPWDRIWGIGYSEAVALGSIPYWGQNLLGKALMEVRKELKDA